MRLLVSNSVTVLCVLLVHRAESVTDRRLRIFGTLCIALFLPQILRPALVGRSVRLLDLAAVSRLRLGLFYSQVETITHLCNFIAVFGTLNILILGAIYFAPLWTFPHGAAAISKHGHRLVRILQILVVNSLLILELA